MLYIHEADIRSLGISWPDTIHTIREAIGVMAEQDFSQPIKPYVRFKDAGNRIIAMPAYIGGTHSLAGIKWIASFPGNTGLGIPRAHSVTILNDVGTGKPLCVINTSLISAIRTASLSGFIVDEFLQYRSFSRRIDVGIVGFGPIGQLHLQMLAALLGDRIGQVYIYDIRKADLAMVPPALQDQVTVCDSWERPFSAADVFITATVSRNGYITKAPKPGSLQLNVSLRDFKPGIMHTVDRMLVDNWEEVCRENTDIELMHKTLGLQKEDTWSLTDFVHDHPFEGLQQHETVMFNPMGMATFDVAMGGHYYRKALQSQTGTILQD